MKIVEKLMLSCQQATMLTEKKQESKLSIRERMHLKMHLLICNACRNYSQQSPLLDRIFKKAKTEQKQEKTLSAEAKARMEQKLKKNN